ncbi:MAG: ATP-binding protein [Ruminiclostridium sp.]|jgi:hypothetical protein|nr:ATP-binding protein [Ruminiclostridium sp.]
MKITRGKIPGAKKCVLYGPEGIGKSTLAAQFPAPLFIDTENGTKELDVARFDKPTSWEMLLQEVRYVLNSPDICKTLVVDTADWAEKLCIKAICDQHQKRGIESFDYGKGYTFVYEGFGELLNLLADVTERGIHVVLTAHAATKRREQPDEFGTYDCWGLKLIDSPKCSIANMVKEWADVLLFANYKTLVVAVDDKGKKHKAQGGSRVMYTSHHPCWDAKNRLGMPEELPLEWGALARYIEAPNAPNPPPPAPTPPAPPTPPPASVPTDVPTAAPSSTAAADPQPSAPQPPAQESPAPSPAQPPERPDNRAALAALRDLMKANGVEDFQVQAAFAARGYFPEETPLENLPADFINGVLVGAWKQVYGWIQANQPLPF